MKLFTTTFLAVLSLAFVAFEPRSADAAALICDDESTRPSGGGEVPEAIIAPTNDRLSSHVNNEKSSAIAMQPTAATSTEGSNVKQFFTTVQCTLEKARPLVEEIEKEAKRLGQTAQRVGLDVLHRFTVLFEKLISSNNDDAASGGNVDVTNSTAAADDADKMGNQEAVVTSEAPPVVPMVADGDEELDNEILDAAVDRRGRQQGCPDGFALDMRGLCQRVDN